MMAEHKTRNIRGMKSIWRIAKWLRIMIWWNSIPEDGLYYASIKRRPSCPLFIVLNAFRRWIVHVPSTRRRDISLLSRSFWGEKVVYWTLTVPYLVNRNKTWIFLYKLQWKNRQWRQFRPRKQRWQKMTWHFRTLLVRTIFLKKKSLL